MILEKANRDLQCLVRYLIERSIVDAGYLSITVVHDSRQDKKNEKDPRAFAYVLDGEWVIFSAANIEQLPPHSRIGVLIHELSHLAGDTLKSEDEEVDTDLWITEKIPEAGFGYEKGTQYTDIFQPLDRYATYLQSVSPQFVERLEYHRD
jgi:hypothetical protein